jgi:hypothetical protein
MLVRLSVNQMESNGTNIANQNAEQALPGMINLDDIMDAAKHFDPLKMMNTISIQMYWNGCNQVP